MLHEAVALLIHGIILGAGLRALVGVEKTNLILDDFCVVVAAGMSCCCADLCVASVRQLSK